MQIAIPPRHQLSQLPILRLDSVCEACNLDIANILRILANVRGLFVSPCRSKDRTGLAEDEYLLLKRIQIL